MAGRILNRRELREQADHAEQAQLREATAGGTAVTDAAAPPKAVKAKKPAAPKTRKPRAKKVPPRLCARWGVFDSGMKQVAVFNYNQRAAADAKLAELLDKKKGSFFLQIVKEQMPEPAPAEVLTPGNLS